MNAATGNETLDRIQQEIKESLEREEELRKKYQGMNGTEEKVKNESQLKPQPPKENQNAQPPRPVLTNGGLKQPNGIRRFTPNPSSKGVMHKFLKLRGKVNSSIQPTIAAPQSSWSDDTPAQVTIRPGKNIRNGFIPAEEKMRRELREFQKREDELRQERRKSQPDLMAAIEAEAEIDSNLKPAHSVGSFYSLEDLTRETYSAPSSLRPAKSLAALCEACDDELETPGTYSLIMQFEKMKGQERS